MRRPVSCDCRCGCDLSPKTLKAFDKADGTLRWQHWLDNVVLASDGSTIYGYAYEQDDSAAAMACTIVQLSGAGSPVTLGIAATAAIRYKKWVRKINADGAILGDSTFYWYTGNGEYTDTPIELPYDGGGWMPDFFGASSSGGLLSIEGDRTLGTTLLDKMIVWDNNNTTTTRKYTIVAAAVRDLATVPGTGAQMQFIAAYDGTNAEQTINVNFTIGMTAAAMATAISAFPHITSVAGTGGPYPLKNIDLTVVWNQASTHFKSVQRQTGTSRGVMTWVRDWNTAEITATLAQPATKVSKGILWQFDASDNIYCIGTNPAASVGSPAEVGIAIEKFTLSGSAYSQAWRTRPTSSRPPIWGGSQIYYSRPAINGSTVIVGHEPGRGNDQPVGDHSEWHEINPATGALVSNGTANNRYVGRPLFASATKLVVAGWDNFVIDETVLGQQCDRSPPNFLTLLTGISGTAKDYFGPYGAWTGKGQSGGGFYSAGSCAADTTAVYSPQKLAPVSSTDQSVIMADTAIMTITCGASSGYGSQVSPDGYFSLGNYYRIQQWFGSPVNMRWNDTGLDWRVAFFTNANIAPTSSVAAATSWLSVSATVTNLQDALNTLLGSNDAGPNAFVQGASSSLAVEDYPVTSAEPCPQMLWQRGIKLTMPANNLAFPPETPPVHYGLNLRNLVAYCYIQVRSSTGNAHQLPGWKVSRMNWSTSSKVWDVSFGNSVLGGAEIGGISGILLGNNYVVSGTLVDGGCVCTYRWTYSAWVLVFADCGIKTATEPATAGTYEGEVREGTCV